MKIEGFLKQQPITVLVDTGSTNNFMNNKVAAWITLQIKDCSKFDIKVADGHVLKCDRKYKTTLDRRIMMLPQGPRGSLIKSCRSGLRVRSLSLEDKNDLKRTGLLGPQLSRVLVD
ncbi:hypothetical protein BHE74_00054748 [Ensete ventricosum]|nr:hypothetical protein BHE74_00054748 [Ensete ventricosum]